MCARLGERLRGRGLGPDPLLTEQLDEQSTGLSGTERIEDDLSGAIDSHQSRQFVAAGHYDMAVGASRQQRAYRAGRAGIVEQDEHPPLSEHGQVRRRGFIQSGRHPFRGNAQGTQKPPRTSRGRRGTSSAYPRRSTNS